MQVGLEDAHDGTEEGMRATLSRYYSGGPPTFDTPTAEPAPHAGPEEEQEEEREEEEEEETQL